MWGMLACAAFAAPNMVADWYGPHPGPDGGQVRFLAALPAGLAS